MTTPPPPFDPPPGGPPPYQQPPNGPPPDYSGGAAFGPKRLTAKAKSSLVKWSIGLAVALVVMVFGFRSVHSNNAVCGRDKMRPGDICRSETGSRTTYSERVASERRTAWLFTAGGAAVVLVSAKNIVGVLRSR